MTNAAKRTRGTAGATTAPPPMLSGFSKFATHGGGSLVLSAGLFATLTPLMPVRPGGSMWDSTAWIMLGVALLIGLACATIGLLHRGDERLQWIGNGAGVSLSALVIGLAAALIFIPPSLVPFAFHSSDPAPGEIDPVTGYVILADNNCTLLMGHPDTSISSSAFSAAGEKLVGATVTKASGAHGALAVTPAPATVQGRYGKLTIAADGAYTYTIEQQEAGRGQVDTFGLQVRLADGRTGSKSINITLATYEYTGWLDEAHHWSLQGTPGADTLTGTSGRETTVAGDGADWVSGLAGNDLLYGGSGNDIMDGGLGEDELFGEGGDDKLYAGSRTEFGIGGSSVVDGGAGNDLVIGNAEGSTLFGGDGDDILVSPYNADIAFGGRGADTFALGRRPGSAAQIQDFNLAEGDSLDLSEVVGDRPASSLADLQSILRTEQEDENLVLHARDTTGSEKKIAVLQGNSSSLAALFGAGAIRLGSDYLADCGC